MFPMDVDGYRREADQKLDAWERGYVNGGAGDEVALRRNQAAFQRYVILPRYLRDISNADTSSTIFGLHLASPVAIAPTALHKVINHEGEIATVRGAAPTGNLMVVSPNASSTLEDIAAVATSPLWMQIFNYRDKEMTLSIIRRAEEAGFKALVLTIDSPVLKRKSNAVTAPPSVKFANFPQIAVDAHHPDGIFTCVMGPVDPRTTWETVRWLITQTCLPLLVKGVLGADDAEKALEVGVKGIIVSNHGGRQLDSAPATALALGADLILVGRPVLWGLAARGTDGVANVLRLLHEDLLYVMRLAGCRSLEEIKNKHHSPLVVHENHVGGAASYLGHDFSNSNGIY